ncbi:DUF1819 family protein [Caldifermentibacillus hisashii]|uniref:DUF1819 family protein n=1 Tax=Caldifermentibacillus hisashii TaxID=996558 RepID=UPI0022B96B1D|nr:DUF1819 family protein [Caldifermentibacillus hisashii]
MLDYSAGFTSEGWFQNEMYIVLQLKKSGLSRKEILNDIIEKNSFQMRSESGIRKRFQMVYRRSETFNDELIQFYLMGSRHDQKALLLYSYLRCYRIPYEFYLEVIKYNYLNNKALIQTVEIDYFIERKETESEIVANWRPDTKKRLRSSILLFFRESGMLQKKDSVTYEISPIHMSTKLKEYAKEYDKLLYSFSELSR